MGSIMYSIIVKLAIVKSIVYTVCMYYHHQMVCMHAVIHNNICKRHLVCIATRNEYHIITLCKVRQLTLEFQLLGPSQSVCLW